MTIHRAMIALAVYAAMLTCGGPGPPFGAAELEARLVELQEPIERRINGQERKIDSLVEFILRTDRRIPARALDPVLVVGQRAVTEYRYDPEGMIFTEPEIEKLRDGATTRIQWGRTPHPDQIQPLDFVYSRKQLKKIRR